MPGNYLSNTAHMNATDILTRRQQRPTRLETHTVSLWPTNVHRQTDVQDRTERVQSLGMARPSLRVLGRELPTAPRGSSNPPHPESTDYHQTHRTQSSHHRSPDRLACATSTRHHPRLHRTVDMPGPQRTPPRPHWTCPGPQRTPPRPHWTCPGPQRTPPRPHWTCPEPQRTPPRPHWTCPGPQRTPPRPHWTCPGPQRTPPRPHWTCPGPQRTPLRPHWTDCSTSPGVTPRPHRTQTLTLTDPILTTDCDLSSSRRTKITAPTGPLALHCSLTPGFKRSPNKEAAPHRLTRRAAAPGRWH